MIPKTKNKWDDPADLRRPNPWVAPEHSRVAQTMERNRDPSRGPVGHIVIDHRPEILVPKRTGYADLTEAASIGT